MQPKKFFPLVQSLCRCIKPRKKEILSKDDIEESSLRFTFLLSTHKRNTIIIWGFFKKKVVLPFANKG